MSERIFGTGDFNDFLGQYGCVPAGVAEACPVCRNGKLREHKLGKMCEGDVKHGVDRCGYKSWRPEEGKDNE